MPKDCAVVLALVAIAQGGCSETAQTPGTDGAGGTPTHPSGGLSGGGSPAGGAAVSSGGQTGQTAGGTEAGGAGTGGLSTGGAATGGMIAGGTSGGGSASGGAASAGSGSGGSASTCTVGTASGAPLSLSGSTFAHDPTMIRFGDSYYRFWTGDYIPVATSNDLTNWSNAPSVYPGAYPEWATDWLAGVANETFNFPWAPDVSSFGGKVHLYSSFSAKFGDNVSCITHLSTSDPGASPWTDHGPVVCTQGSEKWNAIDADVGFDDLGEPYLAFGSFWDGIFAFPLNPDGSRKGNDQTRLAWAPEIEAPVLLHHCGYYYLFVTWGLCCPGEGRAVSDLTYRVAVGRSDNILGPYVDREGTPMLDGGGTLIVQGDHVNWAAAGHSDILVDGTDIYHLYHAYRQSNGDASLRITPLAFDADGWPLPHQP
jgi:arabinan endo-1,5-alpha-L-arabinosidase